jgi:hypothetical protein
MITNNEVEKFLAQNFNNLSITEIWNDYVRASYIHTPRAIKSKNLPSFDEKMLEKILNKLDGKEKKIDISYSIFNQNKNEYTLQPNKEFLIELRNLTISSFPKLKGNIISDLFMFLLKYSIYIAIAIVLLYFFKPELLHLEKKSITKEVKTTKQLTTKPVQQKKYTLTIMTSPSNTRIRILNIKAKYHKNIQLKPGKYFIEISKRGYKTKKFHVVIKNKNITLIKSLKKL